MTDLTTSARRAVALAGHCHDEATARTGLTNPLPHVRASALGALSQMGSISQTDLAGGLADPAAPVRRRATEIAARHRGPELGQMLADPAPEVVEMAAWALGERGEAACVPALATTARTHPDPLCREAAVAAVGAIAAQTVCPAEGLAAVLDALGATGATGDRPAVRRRAVLALAAFEGPAVRAALHAALGDHDWQVRQAAEDLV